MTITTLFGKGFVGSEFVEQNFESVVVQDRDDYVPATPNILYTISTVHNYNVFSDPFLDVETNLLVLMRVLESARKKFGIDFEFNFVSSWFVYGNVNLPANEHVQCKPKGFYSITKKTAEDLLTSYCKSYGIRYRILRLANVLGPKDDKVSEKKNATQHLIKKVIAEEPIPLYYGGDFFRDYIDVRDCARAIKLVIDKGNNDTIYNISNGVPITFWDVIDFAIKYTGSKSTTEDYTKTEFHEQVQIRSMYLSNYKLHKLGYVPEYTIEDTLRWIIDAYTSE